MLLVGSKIFFIRLKGGGIKRKEIAVQQFRDAEQHLGVDAVAFEDAIAGHAAGAELPAQPSHTDALAVHLLTYGQSYVDVLCHYGTTFCFIDNQCAKIALIE